tara:strand:+ start:127 stop:576 length:450 start_codon:yes stop_codon:yes gene_type:complete
MASSISNATLSVTVTESLTLNGANHGSTKRMNITGINEISKRILTIATTGTQVYAGSTEASYGTFVTNDVKYVRITNLDNENFVVLHLEGNSHYAQLSLAPGHVFFLTDVSSTLDSESAIASYSAEDITRIDAMADTAVCDIEILVASS